MRFNAPFLGKPYFNHNSFNRPYSVRKPSQSYNKFITTLPEPNASTNHMDSNKKSSEPLKTSFDTNNNSSNADFFELFGIKLYYDDILLISLIFFLYNEGVEDSELFIALILLLLS